jgi:hypothetical protein
MLLANPTTLCELSVVQDNSELPSFTVLIGNNAGLEVNLNPVGPRGPEGPQGEVSASSIGQLSDVMLTNVQNGDLLVYQSSKFINTPKQDLTDGGNF